jgi:hypothetical protein
MLGIVHGSIDFSAYKGVKLHRINDVALPAPEADGSPNLLTYCTYPLTLKGDWKMREGGVLYALGIYGDFFGCMWNYHSGRKSTGVEEWDALFEELKSSEYRKNIIPCMVSHRLLMLHTYSRMPNSFLAQRMGV